MTAPTVNQEDFFAQSSGGGGGDRNSASAAFSTVGTIVSGTIAEEPVAIQQTKYKTGELLTFNDGTPRMQLIVVLQTELRNWDGAIKPPTDEDDNPKPPEADTGLRALFVKYKLQDAIGDALRRAGAKKLEVGGVLQVKFTNEEDLPSGYTAKLYAAKYTAPAPKNDSEDFFADTTAAPTPTPAAKTDDPPF